MTHPDSHGPREPLPPDRPRLDDDPNGDRFLSAKLSIPPLPPTHLARQRLVKLLTYGIRGRLTAVTAAAGSGKTVMVSSWARMGLAPGPVAWVTLDDEDNAADLFWSYVLAALRARIPGLDLSVDTSPHASSIDRTLLARLAARLAEATPPAVLVLDRCEHITNRTIAADLDLLLRYATPGLRLVVIGRTARLLPLHRYRLAGDLTEIGTDDLALTADETAELLEAHGLQVTDDEVATLYESTQGWMTGVCLHALAAPMNHSATGSPHPPSHHVVGDFLRTEVLEPQVARTRDLLLRTSIVEEVHPSLADRLTGRYDARGMLEELVRVNTFVQPVGQSWYRVHPLFREVLHDELTARHSDLIRRLHSVAARWHADHDRVPEALKHAALVDEWDYAAALAVDRLGVSRLLTGSDAEQLRRNFASLPDDHPGERAALIRAVLALARFDTTAARGALDQARGSPARRRDDLPLPVRLGIAVLEVVLARLSGDSDAAERAAAEVDALLTLLSPAELADGPRTRTLLLANLGAAQLWAGNHAAARSVLSRAAAATEPMTEYGAHDALGHLAMLELAEGRLHRADKYARAAIDVAERAGLRPAGRVGAANVALAAVALQWNDLPAAREHISRALAASDSHHDPATATAIALLRSSVASGRGDGRRALAAVQSARANPAGWRIPTPVKEQLDLAAAGAHLASGDPASARSCIDHLPHSPERLVILARTHLMAGETAQATRLLTSAPANSTPPATLQTIALLRAQIAVDSGDMEAAEQALREALDLARPEHRRRPFAQAGTWLRHLLRQLPDLAAEHTWLSPQLGPREPAPFTASNVVVEPLTAREVDVLRRLAQALSTDDIASELYLSVNTVKTHLKSIYRKLGTSGRSATARRARELNLIDVHSEHSDAGPPANPD
jgi:LuxR family maltose regulon positive regulatory protein